MLSGPIRPLLAALAALVWAPAPTAAAIRVVVLTPSAAEAFAQALEGVREGVPGAKAIDISRGPLPPVDSEALIVALGSQAAASAASLRPAAPTILAMVLESDLASHPAEPARVLGRVFLDVPLDAALPYLEQYFPGKRRLGWIRNPHRPGPKPEQVQARARERGFTVAIADCAGPESLLAALRSLKQRADLVWCEPDSSLYNSATIKPLILASLDLRLPVIGFSESFARAGAAIGIYPDFRDIGRQAGELAARYSGGQDIPARESPRRLKVAVNERMARLLGLRYSAPAATGDFMVLR